MINKQQATNSNMNDLSDDSGWEDTPSDEESVPAPKPKWMSKQSRRKRQLQRRIM